MTPTTRPVTHAIRSPLLFSLLVGLLAWAGAFGCGDGTETIRSDAGTSAESRDTGVVSRPDTTPSDSEKDAAPATGRLAGTVALNGGPSSTEVTVTVRGRSLTPDDSRYFEASGLEPGPAVVAAQAEGFERTSKTVVVRRGRTTTVDLELGVSNHAPELRDVFAVPSVLQPGETGKVTALAVDSDGDKLSYTWSISGEFTVESGRGSETLTVRAPETFGAKSQIALKVKDGEGGTATSEVTLETTRNETPVIRNLTVLEPNLTPGESTKVIAVAADPDSRETLNYSWTSAGSWTISDTSGRMAKIVAPDTYGENGTITVEVEDRAGGTATDSVTLTTGNNEPPRLLSLTANPPQVKPGETVDVRAVAADPHDDQLQYRWSVPKGWTLKTGKQSEAEIVAPKTHSETGKISVTIRDGYGETTSSELSVSTIKNGGPIIASLTANPSTVQPGGTMTLSVQASDPEGQSLSYRWTPPNGRWTTKQLPGKPHRIELVAPKGSGTSGVAKVEVRDSGGKVARATVIVSTSSNRPPAVNGMTARPRLLQPGGTTTVTVQASDPDGDALSYNWKLPKQWTKAGGGGNQIKLEAPNAYGLDDVLSVEIDDGSNQTTATSRLMTVRNDDPTITNFRASPNPVSPGGTVTLKAQASDPEGQSIAYDWSVSSKKWTLQSKNGATTKLTAPGSSSQTAVQLEIQDGHSGRDRTSYRLWTTRNTNRPPTITSVPPKRSPSAGRKTWTYRVAASDRDGDNLTFKLGKDAPSTAKINGSTGTLTWVPDRSEVGSYQFDLLVTDGKTTTRQTLSGTVESFEFTDRVITRIRGLNDTELVADINGDGRGDIGHGYPQNRLFVKTSTKNGFSPAQKFKKTSSKGYYDCISLAAGDIDDDNDVDIVVSCDRNKKYNVYPGYFIWRNDGTGSFSDTSITHVTPYEGGFEPKTTLLADFDDDGSPGLFQYRRNGQILVWTNSGGSFTFAHHERRWKQGIISAMRIGETDGDQRPELLVARNTPSSNEKLLIVQLAQDGSLGRTRSYSFKNKVIEGISNGDFDGDGKQDLSVMTDQSGLFVALRRKGGYTFKRRFRFPSNCWRLDGPNSLADIDGDGELDWVFAQACQSGPTFGILFGGTSTLIDEFRTFKVPAFPRALKVFLDDWNGDGKTDIYLERNEFFSVSY